MGPGLGIQSSYTDAVQCSAVQCSAVQCSAIQCSAIQCNILQYNTAYFSAVQFNAVRDGTEQIRTPNTNIQSHSFFIAFSGVRKIPDFSGLQPVLGIQLLQYYSEFFWGKHFIAWLCICGQTQSQRAYLRNIQCCYFFMWVKFGKHVQNKRTFTKMQVVQGN